MPWEKSFDVSDAIDQAKNVFWKKGYEGSSINDLLAATGLKRGSLYNAFGGKEELFIKALLEYDRADRKAYLKHYEDMDNPRQAISVFFDDIVNQSIEDDQLKGCMLVNTALEFPSHSKEVHAIVKAAFLEIEEFFQRLIELGQARSEIPEHVDARETAKALFGLLLGIRVLARGAFDDAGLKAIANRAIYLIS